MTAYECVVEMITNAYENGYEAEIKDLADEELAHDIWMSIDDEYDLEDLEKAVKEFRNVQ